MADLYLARMITDYRLRSSGYNTDRMTERQVIQASIIMTEIERKHVESLAKGLKHG